MNSRIRAWEPVLWLGAFAVPLVMPSDTMPE